MDCAELIGGLHGSRSRQAGGAALVIKLDINAKSMSILGAPCAGRPRQGRRVYVPILWKYAGLNSATFGATAHGLFTTLPRSAWSIIERGRQIDRFQRRGLPCAVTGRLAAARSVKAVVVAAAAEGGMVPSKTRLF